MEIKESLLFEGHGDICGVPIRTMGDGKSISKWRVHHSKLTAKLNKAGQLAEDMGSLMPKVNSDGSLTVVIRGTKIKVLNERTVEADVPEEELEAFSHSRRLWEALALFDATNGNEEMMDTLDLTSLSIQEKAFLTSDSFYYYRRRCGITMNITLNTMHESTETEAEKETEEEKAEARALAAEKEIEKEIGEEKETKTEEIEIRKGEWIIPFEWDEKIVPFIKPLSALEDFVFSDQFLQVLKQIRTALLNVKQRMDEGKKGVEAISDDSINILLTGKPGTGKSRMVEAISAALGLPLTVTPFNLNTDESETSGKTFIKDGVPTWQETPLLMSHKYGGISLIEEINLAKPSEAMAILGQKIERPYVVFENGVTPIVKHPLNIVIATMNAGVETRTVLDTALANRFSESVYRIDDPTEEMFEKTLAVMTGADKKLCHYVIDAYIKVSEWLKSDTVMMPEMTQCLSLRTCKGVIKKIKLGINPKAAINENMGGILSIYDTELSERLKREVIDPLPELKLN